LIRTPFPHFYHNQIIHSHLTFSLRHISSNHQYCFFFQKLSLCKPDDWETGNEEMTGAHNSYLHTLADEAGEKISDDLTKTEAAKKIEELQTKTGRGKS
jgi:hypothetical protein